MHGQLVVVLGVENQQVDLSLRNEFSVFIDLPPHGNDLFDPDRQALSVDGHPARSNEIPGFLQQLFAKSFTRNVGIDARYLGYRIHVAFQHRLVFHVRQPAGSAGFGKRHGHVDQLIVAGQMASDCHDPVRVIDGVRQCPLGVRMGKNHHRYAGSLGHHVQVFTKAVRPFPGL